MEEKKPDAAIVKILETGKASEFWGTMLAIMDQNVKYLEHQIITKTSLEQGSEGEPLTDEQVEILRFKRQAMKDLMNSPDTLISQLTVEQIPQEDLDPFYNSIEELRKAEENE